MSAFNSTFIKFRILEGDDSLDKCSLIKKVNMFYGFANAEGEQSKLFKLICILASQTN